MTIGAIVLALILMSVVNSQQSQVTETHMPALVAAFEVAQQSTELVRASPRLLAASSPEVLDTVMMEVHRQEEQLRSRVTQITEAEGGEQGEIGAVVTPLVDSLVESIDRIHESVLRRMTAQARLDPCSCHLWAGGS